MGWSTSLILIAIGAVLRWAITASTSGVNLHTVGLIVMIVGAIGFIISILWMVNWAERDRASIREARRSNDYAENQQYPPQQRI